ncbi:unnamed protein product [Rhizophagus irregularis]|uniref:MARVEL domain-containing protein n=1 Tax=Rhizophagus irregularis TaxID=588596 RepID=A0A2I1G5V4_9GLOM|nr:hypothetical protein RhiirA4_441694 [Rhizophagus irregularis]CAB4433806.1 unnamed protein product [Rhizophagus irregularis]
MGSFIRYILGGLVGIWLLLVILAPITEFGKILMFKMVSKAELNRVIEYVYFLISFLVPWWIVVTNCCVCFAQKGILTPKELIRKLIFMVIVWIAISVFYTYFTKNDIGDVPSNCPPDYPYSEPKLRLACIMRTANYVIMWTYTSLLIIFLISVLSGVLPQEEDMKKKGKDFNIKTVVEGV